MVSGCCLLVWLLHVDEISIVEIVELKGRRKDPAVYHPPVTIPTKLSLPLQLSHVYEGATPTEVDCYFSAIHPLSTVLQLFFNPKEQLFQIIPQNIHNPHIFLNISACTLHIIPHDGSRESLFNGDNCTPFR